MEPTADASLTPALREAVEAWVAGDPDPVTRAEARDLLHAARSEDAATAAGAVEELRDRFSGPLAFGTAGLRGALGAGPNRMNRAVVIRAAAGVADLLTSVLAEADAPARVVVGYDARHGSHRFALDTAAVLSGAGVHALLLPAASPTPILAFAVGRLDADAGIMVTASHNPATDNGYKVYLGGRVVTGPGQGAQLVPPFDGLIAERIARVGPASTVPLGSGWEVLGDDVAADYEAAVLRLDLARGSDRPLRVVVTPLHGVGGAALGRLLTAAGHEVHVVAAQADPDPDFPTVAFPNPEEPGALDLALELAAQRGADLVIAVDPDADRCAVALPSAGGWRRLHGDELGALLGEQAARAAARAVAAVQGPTVPAGSAQAPVPASGSPADPPEQAERRQADPAGSPRRRPRLASSVVSSALLGRIAAHHGLEHVTTLTGFKWISRVEGLVFGYEEALGYCVDPATVRDKDGLSAALLVARLAARLRDEGRTLQHALDDLARRHGLHVTDQLSVRFHRVEQAAAAVARLRAEPPRSLAGGPIVAVTDLAPGTADLPSTDALVLRCADGTRVVVRPSGTEPKLKCYLEVVLPITPDAGDTDLAEARSTAGARLAALREDLALRLGA